jgi:membrane-bound lytic murein transglycosylase B
MPPVVFRLHATALLLALGLIGCAPAVIVTPPVEPTAEPPAVAPAPPVTFNLTEPRYVGLLGELETKHGFNPQELARLFGQAKFLPDVPKKFAKPAELLPYDQYRPILVTPEVAEQGRAFLDRNRELMQKIEDQYGVDRAVIAAILGVETKFGRRPDGGYLVFDALNTTFAAVPNREAFARKELIEFLLLCREEQLDPLAVKGSYAGAMGNPQFIASSYRRYTVDFDGDGRRDLWQSEPDILASVANYLKVHGWRKGAPIRLPVTADGQAPSVRALLEQGLQGKTTVEKLLASGVAWAGEPAVVDSTQEISLLAHASDDGEKTVVLFPNFRTILTYNRAVNYVLAVADLSELLSAP